MVYLKLIRYKNLLIIALLQILMRYALVLPILSHYQIAPELSHVRFVLLVVATLLLAGAGYIINDYFDIRIDRINRPDSVLIGKRIKRRVALFLHVVMSVTGIMIGLYLAYVTRKENYALLFIAVPIILWYYSTTFKRHVLIGNLIISFFTAIVALLVVSLEFSMLARVHGSSILQNEACSTAWFWASGFALFAFITNLSREVIKDAEDLTGDKTVGCRTLPIAMGMPLTKVFVVLLQFTSIGALWLIYFGFSEVRSIPYVLPYFILALTVPQVLVIVLWLKASTSKQFYRVSTISKVVMLAGVLFLLLAGKAF